MSNFVPENSHLREALIFCFHLKKNASESHRMLVEAYGEHALGRTQCNEWFNKFKSGDFDVINEERGRPPKKFEDTELQTLLDEDNGQTQQQLAEQLNVTQQTVSLRLKAMGKILKVGRWVPHELSDRQQENRKTTCELLLARQNRKGFLHRIITGDEKWIYFNNPKRKKSYLSPGQRPKSTPRPNRFGRKTMLCIFWDQRGVIWYELLKPGETVTGARYHQQLIALNRAIRQKRPEFQLRHDKIVFQDDNASPHRAAVNKNLVESYNWEPLPHPPYSPDLAPSDYYLFSSMGHALNDSHFNSYEEVQKWLNEWIASKNEEFFWRGIHKLPERWERCVASEGNYFED